MARNKISYVDASRALTESQNRREQSRLEAVQKAIDERNEMRSIIDNARDARFNKDREHSMRMEAARDDNLSKALKAIYITALEPNSLTEMNLSYADGIVDNYINEKGGASTLLNNVKSNSYFLSRLTQIVETAAKVDVHNIENMDHDLEKEAQVTDTDPIPNMKNDVHDMSPETKTDNGPGPKEGSVHEPFEEKPFKDFKPEGEDKNLKQSNESVEEVEEAEKCALDLELFDESVLLEVEEGEEKKDEEKLDSSKDDTDDDQSNIEVKSDGGDVNISIDNSDKSKEEKKEESKEEEQPEEEPAEEPAEATEEEPAPEEGAENDGETEIEDTEGETDAEEEQPEESEGEEEEDSEGESDDSDDDEEEIEIDSETEKEVEDTEAPEDQDIDLSDMDGDGEDDDQDDEDIEDVEDDDEVDEDEEEDEDDDVEDVVGDDIDGSDQDSDDSIDGNDERGTLFKDLEDEPDVKRAIEIIRDRISDAEETFIKNNAKDKEEITKLVDKISNNVKTVQDAGEDSKEGKIAQESAACLDRMRKDLQQGRPVMSIFEKITRALNGSMLKDRQVLESYLDEDTGKLDEGLVIESARVLYGWIETVNTLKLEKVDEHFIEDVLAKI